MLIFVFVQQCQCIFFNAEIIDLDDPNYVPWVNLTHFSFRISQQSEIQAGGHGEVTTRDVPLQRRTDGLQTAQPGKARGRRQPITAVSL